MASINIDEYKNDLMIEIVGCPEIVEAIDSQSENYDSESPDTLIYENIFPYLSIPDTEEDVSTYIMMAVDSNNNARINTAYNEIVITIWVMAHKANMRTAYGATRIDYIGRKLIELLQGQTKFGYKELKLNTNREKVLDRNHLYRELIFTTNDLKERSGC